MTKYECVKTYEIVLNKKQYKNKTSYPIILSSSFGT